MRSLPRSLVLPTPSATRPWRLAARDHAHILSQTDCEALFHRITGFGAGNTDTIVTLRSTWTANFRWGRNRPISSGDTTDQTAIISRIRDGATSTTEVTTLDDASLKAVVQALDGNLDRGSHSDPMELLPQQQYLAPKIYDDATYHMTVQDLSQAIQQTIDPIVGAKLVAAGYTTVGAASWAVFNSRGLTAYAAATGARYSETVRSPDGNASGWAGKSHTAWAQLSAAELSTVALKKCVDSANPVAVEPGHYTAILEPEIVGKMFSFAVQFMDRDAAEKGTEAVYNLSPGVSKLGTRVFDSRITITSDPTDPECGYMPFDPEGAPYRPVTWVENGILKTLAYDRDYARKHPGTKEPIQNPQAFRVSGGSEHTSIEEMIATTERGILVTTTGSLSSADDDLTGPLDVSGVTLNGLWLIEHGKITHPIKNLYFKESAVYTFDKVLQIGRPVRILGSTRKSPWGGGGVFRDLPSRALNDGHMPVVAPAMKVQDFNFTRLSDAI